MNEWIKIWSNNATEQNLSLCLDYWTFQEFKGMIYYNQVGHIPGIKDGSMLGQFLKQCITFN